MASLKPLVYAKEINGPVVLLPLPLPPRSISREKTLSCSHLRHSSSPMPGLGPNIQQVSINVF